MARLQPVSRDRLKAALAARGAAPRRRHGQHFLVDDNLLAAIVGDAGVGVGDRVLEVGPGPGLLTRHLLASGATVVAIEIDPAMRDVARDLVEPELEAGLTWIEADALAGGRRLAPLLKEQLPGCTAMVSNLPYGIAAPLLGSLVQEPDAPERLVVMIQQEMGDRLVARAGSRDYGPLAIVVGTCARARVLRRVPAQAFWPAPRVESVLVELIRRADRPEAGELADLEAFLAAAFHQRRKTLVNSLASTAGIPARAVLDKLGLPENQEKSRAEALDPVQLCALARRWACHAPGERDRP